MKTDENTYKIRPLVWEFFPGIDRATCSNKFGFWRVQKQYGAWTWDVVGLTQRNPFRPDYQVTYPDMASAMEAANQHFCAEVAQFLNPAMKHADELQPVGV